MTPTGNIHIVYDGECPLCRNYAMMARLRESCGPVELINARDDHPVVHAIKARGYDLNEGMVLKLGDEIFYGAQAVHMMALLGAERGAFARLNYWIFSSRRRSALLYPFLRAGRSVLLKVLGRSKIAG